jgi:hypothetical protein
MGRNTTATLTVLPLDDGDPEGIETIALTISPEPSYTSFIDETATLNLVDNDGTRIDVSAGSAYFDEGNDTVLVFDFSLQSSNPVTNPVTIHYTMSGTASNGVDYVDYFSQGELSGSVTIPTGQSHISIWATIINDTLPEGTEVVTLTVTPDPAYELGVASITQYLPDDEIPAAVVGFANALSSGSENAGTVNIPVNVSMPSGSLVTVEYSIGGGSATGGIDYDLEAGLLFFNPGTTTTSIPLTIIDDAFDEPPQTIIIELKHPWGAALGTNIHTFTISDNDNPPFPSLGFAAGNSGTTELAGQLSVLVSLTATQTVPVTVNYTATGGTATNGSDYLLTPGMLTFAPGETVEVIPVAILSDTNAEANETVILSLSNAAGATLNANNTHTLVITNSTQWPPLITSQPQSRTVAAGGSTTLSVASTANPPAGYQWYFNNSLIPAATSSAFTRSNFQSLHEGSYHVVITNPLGSATSLPASLYLDAPLRLIGSRLGTNGLFTTQLIGLAQSNRVLSASTDLSNWTNLLTNNHPSGIITFTDSNSIGLNRRYYRGRTLP